MTINLMLRWWYGPGFKWVWQGLIVRRLHYVSEVFSVSDMLATLFAPFRQTYVGKTNGVSALQAWLDRTVSRGIGFVVRSALLFVALIAGVIILAIGLVLCIAWPILPFLPLVAAALALVKVGT